MPGGRTKPGIESKVKAISDRCHAGKKRGEGPAASRAGQREELRLVEAVHVLHELCWIEAFLQEGVPDELGRAEQSIRQLELLLFARQDVRVEGMFRAWRQRHSKSHRLAIDDLVREARVGIGPFQNGWYSKALGTQKRLECSAGPGMDQIDLVCKNRQEPGDDS